ncbi:unnamed protein product [Cyprideis torosa]|uniref:Small ribosomal subunit protein eS7 n=1 Tax=Cyprideis torosa TaxID=163714 RepID=A0A7R8ZS56_9CRUS|nr:unnamed protein product [Cyprideis torosa]CAG0900764.1 unnamed protein product [Cyprideis torosa]
MDPSKNIYLSPGLRAIGSSLGWIIHGRGQPKVIPTFSEPRRCNSMAVFSRSRIPLTHLENPSLFLPKGAAPKPPQLQGQPSSTQSTLEPQETPPTPHKKKRAPSVSERKLMDKLITQVVVKTKKVSPQAKQEKVSQMGERNSETPPPPVSQPRAIVRSEPISMPIYDEVDYEPPHRRTPKVYPTASTAKKNPSPNHDHRKKSEPRFYQPEMAVSVVGKIWKPNGERPDDLETIVSQALVELETNSDLKPQLRELYILGAKEIDVAGGKKALVVFIPVPQLKQYQKIQNRLVRELEKKFSGKHVVFLAQRRILPRPTRKMKIKSKQKRPRSRTLTAVHDAILGDLVYPAEIVGKRIRIRLDGSRLIKAHLDKASQTTIEHKVDTFAAVYKKITGKEVTFEFPEPIF